MEEDDIFLFFVPEKEFNADFSWDLLIIFFFIFYFKDLEILKFFLKELKILIDFLFFIFWKQTKKQDRKSVV